MMAGIVSRPASWVARQRRSPMMSSNRGRSPVLSTTSTWSSSSAGIGRTTTGWSTPISRMLCASSAMSSSSKTVRGWRGFGRIESTGSSANRAPGTGASPSNPSGCSGSPDEPTVPGVGASGAVLTSERSDITAFGVAASGTPAPVTSPAPSPSRPCAVLARLSTTAGSTCSDSDGTPERVSRETTPSACVSRETSPRLHPSAGSSRWFPVKRRRRRTRRPPSVPVAVSPALPVRPSSRAVSRETSGAGEEGTGDVTCGEEPGVVSRETPSYDVDLALAAELSLKNTSTGRLPDSPAGVLGMSAPRPRPSARRFSLNSINLSQARTAGC